MAFFNELGKKLTQAGQEAAQQTKIFAETTKINSHISDEEKQINNLYMQIGKNYFEANKDNSAAMYNDLMVNILDAQARIEQYKEQIKKIKGIVNCPNCGAEVANSAAFCNACGAKMPLQAVTPVASATPKCPQCGSDVAEGNNFCNICGCEVSNSAQPISIVKDSVVDVQKEQDGVVSAPSSIPTPINNDEQN